LARLQKGVWGRIFLRLSRARKRPGQLSNGQDDKEQSGTTLKKGRKHYGRKKLRKRPFLKQRRGERAGNEVANKMNERRSVRPNYYLKRCLGYKKGNLTVNRSQRKKISQRKRGRKKLVDTRLSIRTVVE